MARKKKILQMMICKECGKETPRNCAVQLYCPECRVIVKNRRIEEYGRLNRKGKNEARSHTGDNKNQISLCLSCTRGRCVGECEAVLSLTKKYRRREQHG